MQEYIVLVNDKNQQIGLMPKLDAHNAHTPLHRAFSCYVFNKEGKFLVTQRALCKKVFPGMWTNSCCGHPGPGETTEDAVKRRLMFELGLKTEKLAVVLPNFRYRAEMKGIVENEICPVYIAFVENNPLPNPDEVEAYKWITWEDFLRQTKKNPDAYSAWCLMQVDQLVKDVGFQEALRRGM